MADKRHLGEDTELDETTHPRRVCSEALPKPYSQRVLRPYSLFALERVSVGEGTDIVWGKREIIC